MSTQKPLYKLQGRIREKKSSYRECAQVLGISLSAFNDKINGKVGKNGKCKEFKVSQVCDLCNFLDIVPEDIPIFFT